MSNTWKQDGRKGNHGQHQKAVIPDWELPRIMKLHENGSPYVQIGLMYGVSHVTISRKIKKAKKWIDDGTYSQRTQQPQKFHNLR